MSYSRMNDKDDDCCTTCCLPTLNTIAAVNEESKAREAHRQGDHAAEARAYSQAGFFNHQAGNHVAEHEDHRKQRDAERDERKGRCVIL